MNETDEKRVEQMLEAIRDMPEEMRMELWSRLGDLDICKTCGRNGAGWCCYDSPLED